MAEFTLEVSASGVSFSRQGDLVTWRWPWSRPSGRAFSSDMLASDFNNFKEYWYLRGKVEHNVHQAVRDSRVTGVSMQELLCQYTRKAMPGECVVALWDIDHYQRGQDFWSKMPSKNARHFLKDVVIMRCDSRQQMLDLLYGVSSKFALACAISNGVVVEDNLDDLVGQDEDREYGEAGSVQ